MAKSKRQDEVPDPARSYERAKPESESGMGRLESNDEATPTARADEPQKTVGNRQGPRQINAQDTPKRKKQ